LIVTSSVAAVYYREFGKDHMISENDFSDEEYQKKNNFWYPLSKTLAEKEVWNWEKNLKRPIRICVWI
jgi:nucleoside-diphosphate-sugar epimerase